MSDILTIFKEVAGAHQPVDAFTNRLESIKEDFAWTSQEMLRLWGLCSELSEEPATTYYTLSMFICREKFLRGVKPGDRAVWRSLLQTPEGMPRESELREFLGDKEPDYVKHCQEKIFPILNQIRMDIEQVKKTSERAANLLLDAFGPVREAFLQLLREGQEN